MHKAGLQELSDTKNGSPGGRQTQTKTDALLRVDEFGVGKAKSFVEMPKGFEELPPTDPQYQGIQGFSFRDFPPLGGEVSKDTTSNMTIRALEAPSRVIGNVKVLKKETELEGRVAPDPKGKAKEQTAAVESVPHISAPVLPTQAPAAPAQQINRPSSFRKPRFSTKDMAEGNTSVKRRVTPTKGKRETLMHDEPDGDWPEELQAKYRSAGFQMVLGGPVTQGIRKQARAVLESEFCQGVSLEQGLMNFIFRGVFAYGLDLEFFMTLRTQGPAVYLSWSAMYLQDGMQWTPGEKGERLARNSVVPTQTHVQSLANGTQLTAEKLEQFARCLVILVHWLVDLPLIPPRIEGRTAEARRTHKYRVEYRLSILCYVAAMAESIVMAGTCLLNEQSSMEHRLLVEFHWLLHKIPEYLVQTNCMDCCEKLDHMGERQAGLQKLWDIIAKTNPAGVQSLQRRMMLQLGELERGGCIPLDQVWSAPTNEELAQEYLAANQLMLDVLEGPSEKFQGEAQAI
jgi:hypothetical protein